MTGVDFLLGLGAGALAVSVILWTFERVTRWRARRTSTRGNPTGDPAGPSPDSAPEDPRTVSGWFTPPRPLPPISVEVEVAPPRVDRSIPTPGVHPPPSPKIVRLSRRVLDHLARFEPLLPGDLAPVECTQGGMVAELGVSQGALTGVLRRMVAAGLAVADRRHVPGSSRRLRAYRLTAAGYALARKNDWRGTSWKTAARDVSEPRLGSNPAGRPPGPTDEPSSTLESRRSRLDRAAARTLGQPEPDGTSGLSPD